MAVQIYPNDLVFSVDGSQNFLDGSAQVSPVVSLASSFVSRARSVADYSGWSVIADTTAADDAQGELSLWVTNASFSTKGDGTVSFSGPVVWVQKEASVITLGGPDASPPYDMALPFNTYYAMQLRYVAQSGSGTLKAQLGRVGG